VKGFRHCLKSRVEIQQDKVRESDGPGALLLSQCTMWSLGRGGDTLPHTVHICYQML